MAIKMSKLVKETCHVVVRTVDNKQWKSCSYTKPDAKGYWVSFGGTHYRDESVARKALEWIKEKTGHICHIKQVEVTSAGLGF